MNEFYQSMINESVVENGLKVNGDTVIDGDLLVTGIMTGTIDGISTSTLALETTTPLAPVNVVATAPTTQFSGLGQILQATSPTTAEWSAPPGVISVDLGVNVRSLIRADDPYPTTQRGTNAVDLCFTKSSGSFVARGAYSFLGNGDRLQTTGAHDVVVGGRQCLISSGSGNNSILGGQTNQILGGLYSCIGGGGYNKCTTNRTTVTGGEFNEATGQWAVSSGGEDNVAQAQHSSQNGGKDNTITSGGNYSTQLGGFNNVINSVFSVASGRDCNTGSQANVFMFNAQNTTYTATEPRTANFNVDKFIVDGDLQVSGTIIGGGGGGGAATELATTGLPVNVDLSAPPTTSQVLKATSATTATWQDESGGFTMSLTELSPPNSYGCDLGAASNNYKDLYLWGDILWGFGNTLMSIDDLYGRCTLGFDATIFPNAIFSAGNTAIGNDAGNDDYIYGNTLVGSFAGALGNGTNNTIVGYGCGGGSDENVHIGAGCCSGDVIGENNVVIGYQSGNINMGLENVVIGDSAKSNGSSSCIVIGKGAQALGTLSDSIVIGRFFATKDNEVVIGNNFCETWHAPNDALCDLGDADKRFKDVHVIGDVNASNVSLSGYSAEPVITSKMSNGTENIPTAVVSGDKLLTVSSNGYDGTSFPATPAASIEMTATNNHSGTSRGADIKFYTTGFFDTTPTEAFKISDNGPISLSKHLLVSDLTGGIFPSLYTGSMVFCSDASPNPSMCFSNGTNWIDIVTGLPVV